MKNALILKTSGPCKMPNNKCLICNSDGLIELLELGAFPPANFLSSVPDDSSEKLELTLLACKSCGHMQQAHFFLPEKLFRNYLYESGTSKTLDLFFEEMVECARETLPKNSKILELACNDGSFLGKFKREGFETLGVEPATNISEIAKLAGLDVMNIFWPITGGLTKKFDAIYAFNVLAHVTNPTEFFESALAHLKEEGFIAVQTSQIHMIENAEFDTIYHEHYSFFTPSSLSQLANKFMLDVSIYETTVHGGSALAIFSRKDVKPKILLALEKRIGENFIQKKLCNIDCKPTNFELSEFTRRSHEFKKMINQVINHQRGLLKKIVFVGAAAKTITVLFYSEAYADLVVDEAKLKIGKYIPSSHLKVMGLEAVSEIKDDCFFIIGAWNFFDELKKKIDNIRPNSKNDNYFAYFPNERLE